PACLWIPRDDASLRQLASFISRGERIPAVGQLVSRGPLSQLDVARRAAPYLHALAATTRLGVRLLGDLTSRLVNCIRQRRSACSHPTRPTVGGWTHRVTARCAPQVGPPGRPRRRRARRARR